MTAVRGMAVAIALVTAALAAVGCGLGPGEDVGEVTLTVTRDFGATTVLSASDEVAESDTVMRVLERSAEIGTRYGGRFVQSIEGISATRRDGRAYDWLFYVNGVEATVGAADFPLRGGEAIWWDHRDWSSALRVPAVVGSWPQPFTGGYEGGQQPVAVECRGDGGVCAEVRHRMQEAGASISAAGRPGAIRILVGPWARLREDPAAATIEGGPGESGVFADFERSGSGFELVGLDERGEPMRAFGPRSGLVAATRLHEAPPVWVITGATPAGVQAAADLLDRSQLRNRYAVATEGGPAVPLPMR